MNNIDRNILTVINKSKKNRNIKYPTNRIRATRNIPSLWSQQRNTRPFKLKGFALTNYRHEQSNQWHINYEKTLINKINLITNEKIN